MTDSPTVAAAVVVRDGRLLLIRRWAPEGSLVWQLPAGKVEPGESLLEAAAREAREEAGVGVVPVRVLGDRVHPLSGRRIVYVACRLLSGDAYAASPREVAEVVWASPGEVSEKIPDGLYGPVQHYFLNHTLPRSHSLDWRGPAERNDH